MSNNERKAPNPWLDFFLGALGLVGLIIMLIRQAGNQLSWKHFIGGFVTATLAFILLLGVCVAAVATVVEDGVNVTGDVQRLSESLASDSGREYMMSRSCTDVMAEYNAMAIAGHDAGVMHVSNTYNIKTDGDPYIAISDAAAKVKECR